MKTVANTYNKPEKIKQWAKEATRGIIDDDIKAQMRGLAYKMADDGRWRGDISERWKEYFDINCLVSTGQLTDLYL